MSDGRRNSELTDMSASLRTFASKGNPTKEQQFQRRQLFQRIIQYLTIGIDMSPLFSDVIMNAHTTDVATKKMLYHYITYYAQAKADLALLTVNTLQKDGRDENPVIRGLAIRSMASMRVPDLAEYLVSHDTSKHEAVTREACHIMPPRRERLPVAIRSKDLRGEHATQLLNPKMTRSSSSFPERGITSSHSSFHHHPDFIHSCSHLTFLVLFAIPCPLCVHADWICSGGAKGCAPIPSKNCSNGRAQNS